MDCNWYQEARGNAETQYPINTYGHVHIHNTSSPMEAPNRQDL